MWTKKSKNSAFERSILSPILFNNDAKKIFKYSQLTRDITPVF